ncbi:MAG: hypothetical protein K2N87_13555 [Eubacterium sp.]|nr:hypothetical protein [Eubacterium sp.]
MEGQNMADIRLKVSPEELRRGAEQIDRQIANVQRSWQRLCEAAGACRHYWEGDAADYGGRLLEETKQEVQEAFCRLKEQPARLLQMAGIYIEAEEQAAQLANALPDNAIL